MNLEQRLEQRLELSPLLLQRLDLLALPLLELRQLVEQIIEQNPVLEEDISEEEEKVELPEDIDDWDTYPKSVESKEEKEQLPIPEAPPTLKESLLLQARLAFRDEKLLKISEYIIYEINDDGFLSTPVPEIAKFLQEDEGTIEYVLEKIRTFDPVGSCCYDSKEYLVAQLQVCSDFSESHRTALEIVEKHFDDFLHNDRKKLLQEMDISDEMLNEAISCIKSCNLKPGNGFGGDIKYVLPDLILQRAEGEAGWKVYPTSDWLPKIRISKVYEEMLRNQDSLDKEAMAYLRNKMTAAKLFLEGIEKRRETISKIADYIMNRISDFFENKTENFEPTTLEEVGKAIERDPSTVSRAINGKWIQTPNGLLRLKGFFSMHKSKSHDEIHKRMKELIDNEDKAHPLKDEQILTALQNEGFKLARTTVVKYRTQLNIPPAYKRKI